MKRVEQRYVGIDLGKRTYTIAIIGKRGAVTLSNGKTHADGRLALYKKLGAGDKVALEAGNLAFIMAKEIIAAVGCEVRVLNPGRLAIIYQSMKKTDKEDALKLARMVEEFKDDRLPAIPLPSDQEIYRRKLVASYRRTMESRTSRLNQLHALFVHQGITTVVRKDLSTEERRKDSVKALKDLEQEEANYLLDTVKLAEERIGVLEGHIAENSAGDEAIKRLRTIPGVGPKIAFAFMAHVAVDRFENASQVSNYLGLVPRVYMSGDTEKYGRITRRGNGYLRALLVQGAWALVRSKKGGALRERYEYMIQGGKSKKRAIVAVARRMAELMYTLLKQGTDYEVRHYTPPGEKKAAVVAALATAAAAS